MKGHLKEPLLTDLSAQDLIPSPSPSPDPHSDYENKIDPDLLARVRFAETPPVERKLTEATLFGKCVAEFIGTLFLILFGVGSVNSAVLHGGLTGLWQVAVVWGLAVAFAIIVSAQTSGAHLNPAVSIALMLMRGFDHKECVAYVFTQCLAATVGGLINYSIFAGPFKAFEEANDVAGNNCVKSFMVFGEYYPNPGFYTDWEESFDIVTTGRAFYIEVIGTAVLMFMIFTVTDEKNDNVSKPMVPWFIGFTVSMLIAVYAPFTQCSLNPARDFGPRIASLIVGVKWCDPRNGFWVYLLAPIVGATLGGIAYDMTIGWHIPRPIKGRRSFAVVGQGPARRSILGSFRANRRK